MKEKHVMEKGEYKFAIKGCLAAIKWTELKPVTILTTACNPKSAIEVNRKNEDGNL